MTRLARLGLGTLAGVGALCGWALPAAAQPAPQPLDVPDAAAVTLLGQAELAEQRIPFSGVLYLASWSDNGEASAVLHISHEPGQGYLLQVSSTPAGGGPVLARPADDTLTPLGTNSLDLLSAEYVLTVAGRDVVAGRSTSVVDALRSDGTVAGRFWIDRRTGLLLRTDVLDLEGRLARSAAFVQVTLGNPHRVGTMNVPPGSVEPSAWPQTLGPTELSDLRRRDWCVRASLPDGLVLYDARMGRANAAQVLQLGYSDGLSTVSVFEQRGRLNAGRLHGWQQTRAGGMPVWQQGVFPQRVVWSAGGLVYTVLADAPASEVTDAVSALPHHSRSPGVWQRVWHGLRRIGSWLDPFH